MSFISRRSEVYATHGMVASSQPLASEVGLSILKKGGNAADAAVATAATLNLTEPCSTGIGGDCFCLFFDNGSKTIYGINGSGRAPSKLSLDLLKEQGIEDTLPRFSPHTVTVPGAAAGWIDTLEKFGTMTIKEVLSPPIKLAEEGFPVSSLTARAWQYGVTQLKNGPYSEELLINGQAPKPGQIMKNPFLANTFKALIEYGKAGFYEGRIAKAIVDLLSSLGGVMSLDDLKNHHSTFDDPIHVNYKGLEVFEIPPNGQGITALLALNILEEFNIEQMEHSSVEHLHVLIETMRIAFADTRWYVADPLLVDIPIQRLISKEYAKKRSTIFNPKRATLDTKHGSPTTSSDTVYFCIVDDAGNACSFINSNYMGFGTGLIPKGCGFTLQNRGSNFSLEPNHPNVLAPNKRPYHTIIPGMAMMDGELYAPFGVMGGFMQPQGHMQVISNMIDFNMNPQEALDAPRFCIVNGTSGGKVALEEGIKLQTMSSLSRIGHSVIPTTSYSRSIFGRGQIITRNPDSHVLCGGSDPRADGLAIGW